MKQIIENGNEAVRGRSINFLGFRFTHERIFLRKTIKKNFAKKFKQKNEVKRNRAIASYKGWCMHCDGSNLYKKITGMSFRDRGIIAGSNGKDGQQYFDVPVRKISEIINRPVTIVSFADNVTTKEGNGRAVILIEDEYKRNYKVITSSRKIIEVLKKAKEYEDLHPTEPIFPQNTEFCCSQFSNGTKEYYLL